VDDFVYLTVLGSGTFKGAICLNAITVIYLEIITQLEEEESLSTMSQSNVVPLMATNILKKVARVAREPLVQILEHLLEQFLHIIAQGDVSLKTYIILSAALSQIKAMEAGGPAGQIVTETLRRCLESCYSLLRPHSSVFSDIASGVQLSDGTNIDASPATEVAASGSDLDSLARNPFCFLL
jgi:fructose-specific phosphotransferase system IIC component